jgi:hypothetical protein
MTQFILPNKPRISRTEATSLWSKLGIAFADEPALGPVDLEMTLLLSLGHAYEHRKTLRLITDWLSEYGDLVHVERLLSLVRRDQWHDHHDDLAAVRTLGALSDRLNTRGDRRWQVVVRECQGRMKKAVKHLPVSEADQFLVTRDGADPHFKKFGILMPTIEKAEGDFQRFPTKKLRPREHLLATNPWLRLRALLGANWRADVLFVILADLADNANQTSHLLGCSYETAHRIWAGAKGAKAQELFQAGAFVE